MKSNSKVGHETAAAPVRQSPRAHFVCMSFEWLFGAYFPVTRYIVMNKFKCIQKLLTIESRPTHTSLIICGRVGLRGDSIKVTRIKFPWIIPFLNDMYYVTSGAKFKISPKMVCVGETAIEIVGISFPLRHFKK